MLLDTGGLTGPRAALKPIGAMGWSGVGLFLAAPGVDCLSGLRAAAAQVPGLPGCQSRAGHMGAAGRRIPLDFSSRDSVCAAGPVDGQDPNRYCERATSRAVRQPLSSVTFCGKCSTPVSALSRTLAEQVPLWRGELCPTAVSEPMENATATALRGGVSHCLHAKACVGKHANRLAPREKAKMRYVEDARRLILEPPVQHKRDDHGSVSHVGQ